MVFSTDAAMKDLEEMLAAMGQSSREFAAATIIDDCEFLERIIADKDFLGIYMGGDGNGNPTALPGMVRAILKEYLSGEIAYHDASSRLAQAHEGYRQTFTQIGIYSEKEQPRGAPKARMTASSA